MKHATYGAAALLVMLGLVGCESCKKGDEALGALKKLKDEMCACTDKTCADKVMEKMMKLGAEHANLKGTEAQQKEAGKITEEAMKCMAK